MNPLSDYEARQRALNVYESFIVQAPAGSGKTELLTQRYLALLGSASKQPEEILAITFTRKAAAEMRTRIINALSKAQNEPEPAEPHAKETYQLAKQVLIQSEKLAWELLDNPNRLRIQTIDSFCSYIVKQMPIVSQFGSNVSVTEDATEFYLLAANRTLELLETDTTWSQAIEHLLIHLDNHLEKLQHLFINMLKCRDQWLGHIVNANPRQQLEDALQRIIAEHLAKLHELIPEHLMLELMDILEFAIANSGQTEMPRKDEFQLEDWMFIANLLLTTENQFRKTFTIKQGFPAPSSAISSAQKKQYAEMKLRAQQLCHDFANIDELTEHLAEVKCLPSAQYTDAQWQMLESLITILPILSAQLQLVFTEKNRVDFIEIAIRSLQALGHCQEASDLALQLDYKLKHILVDEFQDTSTLQFKLLEKLTAGWQPHDGKTLFCVGDPQQSIYRFRKAEVGLFIQAQKNGISGIQLHPLHLSLNFRSHSNLIEWNNQLFNMTFPKKDNYLTGAIAFKKAMAAIPCDEESNNIQLHFMTDETSEGQTITEIVQKTWEGSGDTSIAILVMARSHLIDIISHLRQKNIPYRAIEIDSLFQKTLIQDLYSLTRAIHCPADRLAWLSILRAPWCGLRLNELEMIADTKAEETILERLQQYETLPLAEQTKIRVQTFLSKINNALNSRGKFPLQTLIHATWLALQGPSLVHTATDLSDVNQYLNLLAEFESGGDLQDFALFEHHLGRLNAKEQENTHRSVEIMTIHKAKGLEFDVILLPGLHKKTMQDPHQLLVWQERPLTNGEFDLLLAPINAIQKDQNETTHKIYYYLRLQEQKKIKNELIRLLYVALTRAKKQLHLLCNIDIIHNEIKHPSKGSLLFEIWNFIKDKIHDIRPDKAITTQTDQKLPQNKLMRLVMSSHHEPFIVLDRKKSNIVKVDFKSSVAKNLGTVIHDLFKKLSDDPVMSAKAVIQGSLNQNSLDASFRLHDTPLLQYAKFMLMHMAIPLSEIDQALATCQQALSNILSDERGRWILANHQEAQSELSLCAVINNEPQHLIIDRTFIIENTRWIIDFKTTQFYDGTIDEFFKQQQGLYQEQLETYAKALALIEDRQIKLGLYFPLIPAWHEWNYVR